MNNRDVKILSEAYENGVFGREAINSKEPLNPNRVPHNFYDHDAVNYAYRNWTVMDDEQSREVDAWKQNPKAYLSKFPHVIQSKYNKLLRMYDAPDHQSIEISDAITNLLARYITDPERAKMDFEGWENDVVFKGVNDGNDD